MVKGCHPGHQVLPTNLRMAVKSGCTYQNLIQNMQMIEQMQHVQTEESSQLPTSHPIRMSSLVTTIPIEEWIINHPVSVLYH